ncbi:MAG: trypsin-like peptidase domain-containing protein [Myxococcota bacterium]
MVHNTNKLKAAIARALPSTVTLHVRSERTDTLITGGSGFIWDTEGHIVTNKHVVGDYREFNVRLHDGRELPAELVNVAPQDLDVAVIKLRNAPKDLVPAQIADSASLEVGDEVIAIGAPYNLSNTVTFGNISFLGRTVKSIGFNLIQTDASLNKGNSGGPLVNLQGQIIGINTAIFGPDGTNSGIGMAIPSATFNHIVPRLIKDGVYIKPKLQLLLDGLVVKSTTEGGAAAKAGILAGDVMVDIAGVPIHDYADVEKAIVAYQPGDTVSVRILRQDKPLQVQLTFAGNRPRTGPRSR